MKIDYIIFESEEQSPIGVKNKIKQTVDALRELGYKVNVLFGQKHKLVALYAIASYLLHTTSTIIIIRNHTTRVPFLFPILLYIRYIKKIKIIIDVPSPVTIAIDEIKDSKLNILKKYAAIFFTYMTYPISLYPANRILEYSYENKYFSLGLNKKIKLIGNGISTEDILYRDEKVAFNNTINFIGVAHLAFWHGYDRLIKSIYAYNNSKQEIKANFYIIGEGDVKIKLEQLVAKLHLEKHVFFLGKKEGNELDKYFDKSHIAVSSLALYRKKLELASELKAREYSARGVPFILGCQDFDISSELPFVFEVSNDDSLLDINQIIQWYRELDKDYEDFKMIRNFAEKNLDFKVKVQKDILSVIKEDIS